MKITSITIGIPKYSHLEPETANSIKELEKALAGKINVKVEEHVSACLPQARNSLMQKCLDNHSELFVGFDADTSFTPQQFAKAVDDFESHPEIEVMFSAYVPKGFEDVYGAGKFHSQFPGDIDENSFVKAEDQGVLEDINWAGSNFFILTADTIRKFKAEGFYSPRIERKDGSVKVIAEDIGFCCLLKELDIPFAVNTSVVMQNNFRPEETWIRERSRLVRITLPTIVVPTVLKSFEELSYKIATTLIESVKQQVAVQTYIEK